MIDDNEPIEDTEVQDTEVDTTGETSGDTGDTDDEPAEKPFAAWELPKPEPKVPRHVPYDRFSQVNTERGELFEDNRELAKRNQQLQAEIDKLSKVPDADDLNPDDFDTPQAYLNARDKAITAKIRAEIRQEQAEAEQAKVQGQQLQELGKQYVTNLQAHAAEDKNVLRAKEFFDTYADHVDPVVGRELLSDPNVGHVMVRLATDRDLLTKFFRATPDQAIRLINRVSATIDTERKLTPRQAAAQEQEQEQEDDEVPAQRPVPAPLRTQGQRQAVRAALPVQVKGSSASRLDIYKDADKMTMAQYRKARGM